MVPMNVCWPHWRYVSVHHPVHTEHSVSDYWLTSKFALGNTKRSILSARRQLHLSKQISPAELNNHLLGTIVSGAA